VSIALHRFTIDDYHRLAPVLGDRRTELIDGLLIDMAPIGSRHLATVTRLQSQLDRPNREQRLLVQQPVSIPEFDEPQPDLTILRAPLGLRLPQPGNVALLIEVADSSYSYDRDTKLSRYWSGGIARTWLVDIRSGHGPRLEVWTPAGLEAELISGHVIVEEGTSINLDGVFADLERLGADIEA
jgi:hypothetical protein